MTIDKKLLKKIYSPKRPKIIGTVLIYLALFLSSTFKTLLVLTFFSNIRNKVLSPSTEAQKLASDVVGKGFGPNAVFNKSVIVMLFGSVFEIFVIYSAVSIAIYLSGKRE